MNNEQGDIWWKNEKNPKPIKQNQKTQPNNKQTNKKNNPTTAYWLNTNLVGKSLAHIYVESYEVTNSVILQVQLFTKGYFFCSVFWVKLQYSHNLLKRNAS